MTNFFSILGTLQHGANKLFRLNPVPRTRTFIPGTDIDHVQSSDDLNSQGFAIFPNELLLQILDYLPPFTPPVANYGRGDAAIEVHNTRRSALRALSQTCRSLRQFFLPYAWEYFEIYRGLELPGHILDWPGYEHAQQTYARALENQLDLVTINIPNLASSVVCMDITITEFNIDYALKHLARCLPLLPNLHTLRLYQGNVDHRLGPAKSAFRGCKFPQIQKIIFSVSFYPLISCCTEAKFIDSIEAHINSKFLKYSAPCSKLERMTGPAGLQDLGIIRTNHPLLRDINFYIYFRADFVSDLLHFQRLRSLKISRMEPEDEFTASAILPILDHLRKLQKQDGEEKRLWVHYWSNSPDTVYVLEPPELFDIDND
ncbi:hypothetical protein CPB83DRAFT_856711 [Crepidotus variabilis]|uniref:F-box domain-containing protein n=1 Tax=Crepidotus variabilis TaxID=179855 RepID=A0A9P6JNR9_9AGAR|nr:hypothetical protein CPB83DRAFT_856711 [Crepidotus variabilis]